MIDCTLRTPHVAPQRPFVIHEREIPATVSFVIESVVCFGYDGAMNRLHALLLCLACSLALPAVGEIYKWTDSTGKVHYSDKPPAEAKKQEIKVEAQSFGGPPRTE